MLSSISSGNLVIPSTSKNAVELAYQRIKKANPSTEDELLTLIAEFMSDPKTIFGLYEKLKTGRHKEQLKNCSFSIIDGLLNNLDQTPTEWILNWSPQLLCLYLSEKFHDKDQKLSVLNHSTVADSTSSTFALTLAGLTRQPGHVGENALALLAAVAGNASRNPAQTYSSPSIMVLAFLKATDTISDEKLQQYTSVSLQKDIAEKASTMNLAVNRISRSFLSKQLAPMDNKERKIKFLLDETNPATINSILENLITDFDECPYIVGRLMQIAFRENHAPDKTLKAGMIIALIGNKLANSLRSTTEESLSMFFTIPELNICRDAMVQKLSNDEIVTPNLTKLGEPNHSISKSSRILSYLAGALYEPLYKEQALSLLVEVGFNVQSSIANSFIYEALNENQITIKELIIEVRKIAGRNAAKNHIRHILSSGSSEASSLKGSIDKIAQSHQKPKFRTPDEARITSSFELIESAGFEIPKIVRAEVRAALKNNDNYALRRKLEEQYPALWLNTFLFYERQERQGLCDILTMHFISVQANQSTRQNNFEALRCLMRFKIYHQNSTRAGDIFPFGTKSFQLPSKLLPLAKTESGRDTIRILARNHDPSIRDNVIDNVDHFNLVTQIGEVSGVFNRNPKLIRFYNFKPEKYFAEITYKLRKALVESTDDSLRDQYDPPDRYYILDFLKAISKYTQHNKGFWGSSEDTDLANLLDNLPIQHNMVGNFLYLASQILLQIQYPTSKQESLLAYLEASVRLVKSCDYIRITDKGIRVSDNFMSFQKVNRLISEIGVDLNTDHMTGIVEIINAIELRELNDRANADIVGNIILPIIDSAKRYNVKITPLSLKAYASAISKLKQHDLLSNYIRSFDLYRVFHILAYFTQEEKDFSDARLNNLVCCALISAHIRSPDPRDTHFRPLEHLLFREFSGPIALERYIETSKHLISSSPCTDETRRARDIFQFNLNNN